MIVKRSVIPIDQQAYSMPTRIQDSLVLAISDGKNVEHIVVHITAVEKDWGPQTIRLEGYTDFRGSTHSVIAVYRIKSTGNNLGVVELSSP